MCAAITSSLKALDLQLDIKEFQRSVIEQYSQGNDCFCVAGTGAGKSLIYILCPFIMDILAGIDIADNASLHSIVLIVQPLKALMRDQKDKLLKLGLAATYVGEDDLLELNRGVHNYIIASPETATSTSFLKSIETIKCRMSAFLLMRAIVYKRCK